MTKFIQDPLANEIQQLMISRKLTLALAESCTGGAIAARLTKIPGSSQYFLGSLVIYSNELKTRILGVSSDLIEKYGAVSQEVVEAMVKGLLKATKADYGIAITGIAGPGGGSVAKPVGTIWMAIGDRFGEIQTQKLSEKGTRTNIIENAVDVALKELLKKLQIRM